ncbi:MAG: HepT-like ribonuclease domain-containing protein [Candidatus Edwardsbacteria bacterium]
MKTASIKLLKDYFSKRPDVLMAFIFGSYAKGHQMQESDFDVAVYLRGRRRSIEGDEEIDDEKESEIWFDVVNIVKKDVDLICLNNAPASLVSQVIKTAIPLIIKDKKLYWEIYLKASLETEDFLKFAVDFWKIKKRAKSLTKEEKSRLLVRIDFWEGQIEELFRFRNLTFKEYQEDIDKRRIIERWAENIINATIDIAKIILASEKKSMPRTYEEALQNFGIFAGLTEKEAKRLSRFANLRNILAHEYLDILYHKIQNFIKEIPTLYKKISNFLEKYLKA